MARIIEYGRLSYNPLGELICKTDINIEEQENKKNFYEKYLTEEEVEKGLKDGTLIEGLLRINSNNRNESYVKVVDRPYDIRIYSVKYRNRALDNEIVIVKLLDLEERMKAEVAIQERKEKNELKDKENYEISFTRGLKKSDYIPERSN